MAEDVHPLRHPTENLEWSGTGLRSGADGWSRTFRNAGGGANRNLPADHFGDATGLLHHHRARDALRPRHAMGFADGPRHAIRHLAGAALLDHAAGGVGNALGAGLTRPGAGGVRHLAGDAFFPVGTGGIGDLLGAAFPNHAAGGIRDASRAGFASPGAGGVGDALGHAAGDLAAGGVRDPAVLDFRHHPCAADLLGHSLRAPHLAADGAGRALDLFGPAATRFVDAAARFRIKDELPRVLDTAFDNRSGNAFRHGLPLSALDGNTLPLGHGTEDGLAHIAVAGLRDGLVRRAAHVAVTGLIARLADRVTHVAVTGVVDRPAHRVGHIAVTGLVTRLADFAADGPVAGLVARLADRVTDVAVTGLVHRPADGVALVAIARVVDGPLAGHGDLLKTGVVDRLTLGVVFRTPDSFPYGLILLPAAHSGIAVISARSTVFHRATPVPPHSAEQAGFGLCCTRQRHDCGKDRHPRHVSHGLSPHSSTPDDPGSPIEPITLKFGRFSQPAPNKLCVLRSLPIFRGRRSVQPAHSLPLRFPEAGALVTVFVQLDRPQARVSSSKIVTGRLAAIEDWEFRAIVVTIVKTQTGLEPEGRGQVHRQSSDDASMPAGGRPLNRFGCSV